MKACSFIVKVLFLLVSINISAAEYDLDAVSVSTPSSLEWKREANISCKFTNQSQNTLYGGEGTFKMGMLVTYPSGYFNSFTSLPTVFSKYATETYTKQVRLDQTGEYTVKCIAYNNDASFTFDTFNSNFTPVFNTSISMGNYSAPWGGSKTVSATLKAGAYSLAGQQVLFRVGNNYTPATTNSSGVASASVYAQSAGEQDIIAIFSGVSDKYKSTSVTKIYTGTKHNTTLTIQSGDLSVSHGTTYNIEILLEDGNQGGKVNGVTVTLKEAGGNSCNAVSNSLGIANCDIRLTGSGSLFASHSSSNLYYSSSSANNPKVTITKSANLQIANTSFYQYENASLEARLVDKVSGAGVSGKLVRFAVGSNGWCEDTTNNSGYARCTISGLNAGGNYTAEFAGDSEYPLLQEEAVLVMNKHIYNAGISSIYSESSQYYRSNMMPLKGHVEAYNFEDEGIYSIYLEVQNSIGEYVYKQQCNNVTIPSNEKYKCKFTWTPPISGTYKVYGEVRSNQGQVMPGSSSYPARKTGPNIIFSELADVNVDSVIYSPKITKPNGIIDIEYRLTSANDEINSADACIYLLPDDLQPTMDDNCLKFVEHQITASAPISVETSIQVPSDINDGEYNLYVVADPFDNIVESNENNVVWGGAITIDKNAFSPKISNCQFSLSSPFTISLNDDALFQCDFDDPDDEPITVTWVVSDSNGNEIKRDVDDGLNSGCNNGHCTEKYGDLTKLNWNIEGEFKLKVTVSATDGNASKEWPVSVIDLKPDLIVYDFKTQRTDQTSVFPGDEIKFTYSLKNNSIIGTGIHGIDSCVYISDDDQFGNGDDRCISGVISALFPDSFGMRAGEIEDITAKAIIPEDVSPGNEYYFFVMVDPVSIDSPQGDIVEQDETNNKSEIIRLAYKYPEPDLYMFTRAYFSNFPSDADKGFSHEYFTDFRKNNDIKIFSAKEGVYQISSYTLPENLALSVEGGNTTIYPQDCSLKVVEGLCKSFYVDASIANRELILTVPGTSSLDGFHALSVEHFSGEEHSELYLLDDTKDLELRRLIEQNRTKLMGDLGGINNSVRTGVNAVALASAATSFVTSTPFKAGAKKITKAGKIVNTVDFDHSKLAGRLLRVSPNSDLWKNSILQVDNIDTVRGFWSDFSDTVEATEEHLSLVAKQSAVLAFYEAQGTDIGAPIGTRLKDAGLAGVHLWAGDFKPAYSIIASSFAESGVYISGISKLFKVNEKIEAALIAETIIKTQVNDNSLLDAIYDRGHRGHMSKLLSLAIEEADRITSENDCGLVTIVLTSACEYDDFDMLEFLNQYHSYRDQLVRSIEQRKGLPNPYWDIDNDGYGNEYEIFRETNPNDPSDTPEQMPNASAVAIQNGDVIPHDQTVALTWELPSDKLTSDFMYRVYLSSANLAEVEDIEPYFQGEIDSLTFDLSDLVQGTTYYWQVAVSDGTFMQMSDVYHFETTSGVQSNNKPLVSTNAASNIAHSTANLNATVNPNGITATLVFEYGTTSAYGSTSNIVNVEASSNYEPVNQSINNLLCGTYYNYRVSATNAHGTSLGTNKIFITNKCLETPPIISSENSFDISSTGAKLQATVNPNGLPTSVYIEYGSTASMGVTANTTNIDAGEAAIIFTAPVRGLVCGTTYYYGTVAINESAKSIGESKTFATSDCTNVTNEPPVSQDVSYLVSKNSLLDGTLVAVDEDFVTYSIVSFPNNGSLNNFNRSNGAFTYTPNTDFEGDDSFTFIANDGEFDSNIATVTINVTVEPAENQKPTVEITSPINNVVLNNAETSIQFTGTASDSDGAISSVYYRVNASEWSILSGIENWHLEVTELVEGDNLFEFKAIDNVGQESATPYPTVLVTVSSDIQGTQLTLNDGDSYDFSEKITYQYSSGDFYYHSNLDNGTHSFLANNLGQRGLVDLGIIIDKTPSNIALPLGGYQIYGVDAVEGHSYTSLAQEGEEGNVIFFTVLQLDDTSVTIDYQYLPENSFIVQEPKLIINYTVEDTTLQSCIDFIASENSFSYVHQVTDLSCIDYPNISSLAGLEHYTNLNKLQIVNGSVASLEPLSVLKSLKTLVISGGEVDDISPIVDLYNLTWLVLQQQNISDISLIDSLTKLKVLTLSNNNILDITSLGKLTKLTNLYLSDNQLGDISPLKTLTALTEFDLRFNNNITCVDVSEYFYSIDELPAECLVSSTLDSDLDGIPDFEDQFPNDSSVHLTLKTFGDGSGIIEVLDSGISCEQECTVQLITDTEYSINATLDQGTASLGWGGSDNLGCRNGSGPTYCNDVAISGYVIAQINLDIDTDFDGEGNSVDSDDDNDGLSDADELLLGTDPLSKDSDGDGYIDGVDDFPLDPNKWQHVGEENDDTSSPILTELSVSSIQVDTRLMSQNVQVTISITDDLSGFAYSGNKCSGFVDVVVFTSPSGNQNVKINNCSFELEEGSYLEGKFVATASFPQYSEEGMWQISSLIIEDQAGNMSSLSSEELENHPVTIEVISQSDTLTPVLTGLSTSLTQVITSLSEQDIKVELTITDDLSGFAYSDDKCSGFVDGVVFTSPSGNQNVKVNNCSFELVEGSDLEGKFVAIASFPQYSEEGMWQISSMIIEDQVGNKSFLSSENLTTFAVTVEVMADSDRDGIPDNTELLYGMSIDDASDAILDLDGDFLSNLEEYLLGTNPTKEDTDDDGYKDSDEASSASDPLDSESLPLDTDGDFISNVTDTDDDNDGIVDTDDEAPLNSAIGDSQAPIFSELAELSFEAVGVATDVELITPEVTDNNLNAPTVVSNYQAALELGSHEVTWTATDFSGNVSTAVQLVHIVDTTAPEFGDLPVHTIDGRGLLTNITNDISILSNDVVDGEVTATIVGDGIYASGTHKVTIAAQDTSENKVESVVEVHINPQVELSGDRKVEPGAILDIPVQLSGYAAIYPVFINYEVIGVNFVVEAAQLQIVEGVSALLSVTIPSDAVGGQTVAVNLTSAENAVLSNAISTELTVDEENHSPTLQLSFKQNGQLISVVDAQGGIVTVTAIINDMNMLDTHEVSWSTGDSLLVDLDADNLANTFEFSPELLIAGTYGLSVEVQENNTSNLYAITVDIDLLVNTDLTLLNSDTDSDNDGISDADEGYADNDQDGIANYLDINDSSNQLPIGDGIAPMQTVNGLSLSLGDIVSSSQGLNAQSAAIEINDIIDNGGENGGSVDNAEDSYFTALSTIINFNVSGLLEVGDTAAFVIPLAEGINIPENAVYRKYKAVTGWFTFVVDEANALLSASKDSDGNCPAPLSAEYQQGLNVGDNCIQLLIEDGGPNDADGLVNAMIKDPGVLAIQTSNQAPSVTLSSHAPTFKEGVSISLSAQGLDADDDSLSYLWEQISGPSISLSNASVANVTFTAPEVSSDQTIELKVTVSDGIDSVSTTTSFVVTNVAVTTPPKESSSGGGGSMGWLLILLSFGVFRKSAFK